MPLNQVENLQKALRKSFWKFAKKQAKWRCKEFKGTIYRNIKDFFIAKDEKYG